MGRILTGICAGLTVVLLTGCAGVSSGAFGGGTPVGGWVYTGVTVPSARLHAPLDEDVSPLRTGSASAVNVLGIVGAGNAGVDRAMRAGNITKIHHIDHKVFSFLGIYSKWTVVVHGE